jgi:hypothetical protein
MLSKALVFKKDASCIDNWAAFSFDEPQRLNRHAGEKESRAVPQ